MRTSFLIIAKCDWTTSIVGLLEEAHWILWKQRTGFVEQKARVQGVNIPYYPLSETSTKVLH